MMGPPWHIAVWVGPMQKREGMEPSHRAVGVTLLLQWAYSTE